MSRRRDGRSRAGRHRDRRPYTADELDPRSRMILRAVVQAYAETGEPVASNTLAAQPSIALSSASVRAVLADLEALGYLDKPHTSAGRIPTDKGYRFYVDALVRLREVGERERELIDAHYDPARALAPPDLLLADTSRLLHTLTRYAGVVSTARADEGLSAIDFLRLRGDRVLAVCVTRGGSVRNRLLTVDPPLTQEQLDEAGRYLTSLLGEGGRTFREVREVLAAELQSERARYDALSTRALQLGTRALGPGEEAPAACVVLEGETSLVGDPTIAADLAQLRTLLQTLEQKERVAQLLDRAVQSGELTLFIGEELGWPGAEGLAVVVSPYGRPGEKLGAIGVIGPSRMAYGRVIPVVEYTARALSRSLVDG